MNDTRRTNICFHGIGEPKRTLESGEARYWVGVDQFRRIMDEIVGWPNLHVSFDDGNSSDIEIGLDALVERGLTATFFALAGRLASAGSLGADDVRELERRGMTIGTHGMDHISWRGLGPVAQRRELVEARSVLRGLTTQPVVQAALPLGQYDRALLLHLRRLGYASVHTSDRQLANRVAWMQPRFSVRSGDTVEGLRSAVLARPSVRQRIRYNLVGVAKRLR